MGIERELDLSRRRPDLRGRGVALDQTHHALEVLGREHAALRKRQLVDGVVRDVAPVDQVLEDVAVHPEGQHRGNGLEGGSVVLGKSLELVDPVDVLSQQGPEGRFSLGHLEVGLCHVVPPLERPGSAAWFSFAGLGDDRGLGGQTLDHRPVFVRGRARALMIRTSPVLPCPRRVSLKGSTPLSSSLRRGRTT
jgi:hypothetical protein